MREDSFSAIELFPAVFGYQAALPFLTALLIFFSSRDNYLSELHSK
jgi:hypothetical protein